MKRNIDARAFLESIADMRKTDVGDTASYYTDAVDGKTSSLLTHVSIMLAVLAIFYSTMPPGSFAGKAILVELLLYLAVTLGCLLSINILGPGREKLNTDQIVALAVKIAVRRSRVYQISWLATFVVTIAFMMTLAGYFLTS